MSETFRTLSDQACFLINTDYRRPLKPKIYRNYPNSLSVNSMKISKYDPKHEDDILSAINEDPDWDMFSNDAAIE